MTKPNPNDGLAVRKTQATMSTRKRRLPTSELEATVPASQKPKVKRRQRDLLEEERGEDFDKPLSCFSTDDIAYIRNLGFRVPTRKVNIYSEPKHYYISVFSYFLPPILINANIEDEHTYESWCKLFNLAGGPDNSKYGATIFKNFDYDQEKADTLLRGAQLLQWFHDSPHEKCGFDIIMPEIHPLHGKVDGVPVDVPKFEDARTTLDLFQLKAKYKKFISNMKIKDGEVTTSDLELMLQSPNLDVGQRNLFSAITQVAFEARDFNAFTEFLIKSHAINAGARDAKVKELPKVKKGAIREPGDGGTEGEVGKVHALFKQVVGHKTNNEDVEIEEQNLDSTIAETWVREHRSLNKVGG
ncbi:hypothetical protein AUEXF2481DRAFT_33979 [Aureobasidium subglaciale EXF-2481]|uniref:Uncharacterized protein n=1 Tax=Aureobasidium subglaciale (strain EXF-2481) TaxID=1043005 RepID=A0A074YUC3_AURSE|nr:uncharacterized protein AUEXF2481DRAFT_33979 [Aureobasidium subglaciale EXF-2481]KAI5195368.1 hypothetical protein E4T38_09116 [Aureobasidium subglaciale]KAI5214430.1 hypothetical protein E4T40_09013 [Aureobasidium subglaciale]KAI5216999.1 hypothetical protein E4T41_09015 [Aureobasidium subglaciale]KAI5254755.1 hypothetical protein E4T46_09049 [Aureobasidium subglaciale]KEQ90441.1 hypothetical protein AUEXF2481DRAFT_33979 [Aureobasidium subglaciale EXF-2481]